MEDIYFLNKDPAALRPASGIIKADQYLDFVRAEDMIARAQQEAEEIIARARLEAKNTIAAAAKAYQEEKEKGHREGLENGHAEISGRITATAAETTRYLNKMADKMVELAMRMLRTILGEIDNRELVEKIVFKTIKGIRDEGRLTIRVHPECVDHIRDKIFHFAGESGQEGLFEVVGEPRLDKNGCILESEIGYVDSSLNTQLKAIRESFENSIKKHQATHQQNNPEDE
jgi:type III secretion protein L